MNRLPKLIALLSFSLSAFAQEGFYHGAEAGKPTAQRNVFVGSNDTVFPHFATGGGVGGWETILVLINMSPNAVSFSQDFYGQNGQPLAVTFRSIPEGVVTTASHVNGVLPANQSFNILLENTGPVTRVGWSSITYDSTLQRLGGYGIFRQVYSPSKVFEALVPLTAYDDDTFYMPFDNLEGFATGLALVNPGSFTTSVHIIARSLRGDFLGQKDLVLPAGNQTTYNLATEFPAIGGKAGTILIQGSTNRLAGIGFRFNLAGGGAFTSIPILNWSG
ncbi:MAG: hypothetical protein ABI995_10375, partial [Acidobacteriota bacterium]